MVKTPIHKVIHLSPA